MAKSTFKPSKKSVHKIAFYIRVSTEEQAENPEGSIRNQEERLRATVQLKNSLEGHFGDVAGIFIDRAKSGKDTNRPELQRLLSSIRKNEISLVMVSELSRLSRSIKDFSEIWELMQRHECGFLSLRENFDTTTAAGEMVLYTVANIAQFERRQVAERVVANIQSRASRGLYNGGVVPLGYRINPERRGFLEIDPQQAEIVHTAFSAFNRDGSLSIAAKWLNANGFNFARKTQGGGNSPRLGHFTNQNLGNIIKNKAYIGVKTYNVRGEVREAKAVWEPIIDDKTFFRAQEILQRINRSMEAYNTKKYTFPLTGILQCGTCGERLCGKTAHGNGGKIPYYEHAWATKRQSCLVAKVFSCNPNRILAKIIEPKVWEVLERVLSNPKEAAALIKEAKQLHVQKSDNKDLDRLRTKVIGIDAQLEALAERIAGLPKSVSAAPFFKQMEKIEALKAEETTKLRELEVQKGCQDEPASIEHYSAFLKGLRAMGNDPLAEEIRKKIMHKLVTRIEVLPDTFRVHFHVGGNYVEGELIHSEGSDPLNGGSSDRLKRRQHFFSQPGSNKLENGVHKPLHIERSS